MKEYIISNKKGILFVIGGLILLITMIIIHNISYKKTLLVSSLETFETKINEPETARVLTEEELLFSQIIRDADKLDIFYIWKDMEFDKVEGKIDDKIYNRMLTCEYDYENINNKLDYYVLLIGFVYDINYYI